MVDPVVQAERLQEPARETLVLVGDHGDAQSRLVQRLQALGRARIRLGFELAGLFEKSVVMKESLEHRGLAGLIELAALESGGALHQRGRAAADHPPHLARIYRRPAALGHRSIERFGDVRRRVEQCAVEIEQHRLERPATPPHHAKRRLTGQ